MPRRCRATVQPLAAIVTVHGLGNIVILSEAKNLVEVRNTRKILRFAQNDWPTACGFAKIRGYAPINSCFRLCDKAITGFVDDGTGSGVAERHSGTSG
jgi:hypothetical protein